MISLDLLMPNLLICSLKWISNINVWTRACFGYQRPLGSLNHLTINGLNISHVFIIFSQFICTLQHLHTVTVFHIFLCFNGLHIEPYCFSHVLFPYPSTGWAGCLDAHFSTFWCCMIYAISDFMEMLQPLSPCFEILTGTVLTWCLSIVPWFWDWILKKGSTEPSHHHSVELEFGLALTDWYRATHDWHRLAWINIDWHEIGMRLAWTCMGLIWTQSHNNSLFHFSFDFELWSERDK